jgi:hypothetical protein
MAAAYFHVTAHQAIDQSRRQPPLTGEVAKDKVAAYRL